MNRYINPAQPAAYSWNSSTAAAKISEATVLEPIAMRRYRLPPPPPRRARLAQHKHDEAEAATAESIRAAGAIPETWYWPRHNCRSAEAASSSEKANYDALLQEALTLAGTPTMDGKGVPTCKWSHGCLRSRDLEGADQHYQAWAFPAARLEAGLAQARLHLANSRLEDASKPSTHGWGRKHLPGNVGTGRWWRVPTDTCAGKLTARQKPQCRRHYSLLGSRTENDTLR